MSDARWVVESLAIDEQGVKRGTFRLYVGSEVRARELVAASPGSTYREALGSELESIRRAGRGGD